MLHQCPVAGSAASSACWAAVLASPLYLNSLPLLPKINSLEPTPLLRTPTWLSMRLRLQVQRPTFLNPSTGLILALPAQGGMYSVMVRVLRSTLLMIAFGVTAPGCGGDVLVLPHADASGLAADRGLSLPSGGDPDGGCSSPAEGRVCTMVGCKNQVAATVTVNAAVVPAGTHTILVTADGVPGSCTFPFPPADPTVGVGTGEQCSSGLSLDVWVTTVCTTTQSGIVTSSQCEPVAGKFTETITINGTPTTLRIQQLVGGTMISDKTVSPSYVVNQPNGPCCEPTCRQAGVDWTIPE